MRRQDNRKWPPRSLAFDEWEKGGKASQKARKKDRPLPASCRHEERGESGRNDCIVSVFGAVGKSKVTCSFLVYQNMTGVILENCGLPSCCGPERPLCNEKTYWREGCFRDCWCFQQSVNSPCWISNAVKGFCNSYQTNGPVLRPGAGAKGSRQCYFFHCSLDHGTMCKWGGLELRQKSEELRTGWKKSGPERFGAVFEIQTVQFSHTQKLGTHNKMPPAHRLQHMNFLDKASTLSRCGSGWAPVLD